MPIYSAYGLAIRSDIDLPALTEIDADTIDIEIRGETIPEDAGGKTKFRNWEAESGRFLSHFHNVGRILVTGGDTILYDREAGADDTQIVSILLGTSLAAALMQRELVPIHSCSVMTDKGAVLVMGRSGAGKSTMLGGLLELGLPMIADDVTGLDIADDGTPIAIPGFPAMRLWQDSLERLGRSSEGLAQVRSDMAKYYLPVPAFHNHEEPIRAIIHITGSNKAAVEIEPIAPANKVEMLSRYIFRKSFIDGMGLRPLAFGRVAATVDKVTMLSITRPAHAVKPRNLAQQMLDEIGKAETAS
ncbi:hypothetical protein [Pontixanthobacter aquaemixtae]|uniref:HPr kinase/phosphorylase n=1 Tax=Pontixanthobacter aquaemixtae TaxID=1958940 RepID=A0A844ZSI5_9SPHN|nr:hypothetical protein [Pontixanthobacter aquaemixtae]MXO90815.1 hypothetical protein [Pontixanthobacter aquaemixtae]